MRNPVTLVIVVVLAVVAAVILVRAANRPDTPGEESGYMTERGVGADATAPLAAADMTFVTRAAESGNAEIDLAQLAQRTSENSQIDALAEQIERDHEQANEQLADLADRRDVDFPNTAMGLPGPTDQQQAAYDRLDRLEGAAFDQAWLDHMAESHQSSIDRYTTASKSTDADVKAYADKTLPVIRHHLEQIESLQKTAKAPARR